MIQRIKRNLSGAILFVTFCIICLFFMRIPVQAEQVTGWKTAESLVTATHSLTSIDYKNKIYLFSKTKNEIIEYDPITGKSKAIPYAGDSIYSVAGYNKGTIYVYNNKKIAIYNPDTNSFTDVSNLPALNNISYYVPYSVVVNDKIYVQTVYTSNNVTKDCYQIYDVISGEWTANPMRDSYSNSSYYAYLNGKIYRMNGIKGDLGISVTNYAEAYNIETGQYETIKATPKSLYGGSAFAYNGKIYMVGGYICNYSYNPNCVAQRNFYEYDPKTNNWTTLADMSVARGFSYVHVIDNVAYVIGGAGNYHGSLTSPAQFVSTVETYTFEAPLSLSLSGNLEGGNLKLTWNDILHTGDYSIKRGLTPGGPYDEIALAAANTFTDDTFNKDLTYYYIVEADTSEGRLVSNEFKYEPVSPNSPELFLYLLIHSGGSEDLTVLTLPNGEELAGLKEWSTTNEAIAQTDQQGTVTGISPGICTISVKTADGWQDIIRVKVISPNDNHHLALKLKIGKTATLIAADDNGENQVENITWLSSNNEVARVQNGVITALNAGTATITVLHPDGSWQAIAIVKVLE